MNKFREAARHAHSTAHPVLHGTLAASRFRHYRVHTIWIAQTVLSTTRVKVLRRQTRFLGEGPKPHELYLIMYNKATSRLSSS